VKFLIWTLVAAVLLTIGGVLLLRDGPGSGEEFPPAVLAALHEALSAYEGARSALARDRLTGVAAPATAIASSLREAEAGSDSLSPRLRSILAETGRIATSLAEATELTAAREAFGELSRLLLVLANADPRLLEGWHVYSCPMTTTFPKWMQPTDELENPFMGQAMASCGVESDRSVTPPASLPEVEAHVEHAHEGEISHYTCSMHPSVRRKEPGTCPICSMDLVPVTREEVETGVIFMDAERRQAIGVRTAPVARREIEVRIRAAGKIVHDETRLSIVTVKYRGFLGKLHANTTGVLVRKGKPLFTLYSPELYAAQEELFTALESQRAARETAAPERADYLVEAARKRLRLWDLTEEQVDEIVRRGAPEQYLPILSPVDGYVIEKNVLEGAPVAPGDVLYRIAGLDRIWIDAEVYESELPSVAKGQEAEVTLPYLPGKKFRGRVSFVYPYLEDRTRTGRIRVELPNPRLELKPDMYANVELVRELGEKLVVPEEAVLYTGPRRLVFLDLGEGRLRPQEIEIGAKSGDDYEVLSGLKEGDVVVTSGNFLVAAESRLKSATKQWGGHEGH
jgi:Cu(I)/Ag(I) efflux system membrane fusion protein